MEDRELNIKEPSGNNNISEECVQPAEELPFSSIQQDGSTSRKEDSVPSGVVKVPSTEGQLRGSKISYTNRDGKDYNTLESGGNW